MAAWANIKFFWDTMLGSAGSTLTATSTDSTGDYSTAYIYNMSEVNKWKAASSTFQIFGFDAGAGNSYDADYLIVSGHNLFTVGAEVFLQCSTTGAYLGEHTTLVNTFTPISDDTFLIEFSAPGVHRYWRFFIQSMTGAPYMAICIWGNKTELEVANASFDPHGQKVAANVNMSYGGYVTGIHIKHTERVMTLSWEADAALYAKILAWWEGSGLKNFFVAWDTANNPTEVYLMRPEKTFINPMSLNGAYRNVTLKLTGRKE